MTGLKRILVVEDDGATREMIAAFLGNSGYAVFGAADGFEMQRLLDEQAFDLVLLDLNLPDADGLELARMVRARSRIAIVILTERASPEERAAGLEIGADDYVAKPFFPRELLARVRNVLDRTGDGAPALGADTQRLGPWLIDRTNRRLIADDGPEPHLTGAEFDLLCAFLDNPGTLLDRAALAALVDEKRPDAGDRSVDILVSRLRKKLGDDRGDSPLIETVRGHGYRLSAPVDRLTSARR